MISANSSYNLDLAQISPSNQPVFDLMVNAYDGLTLGETESVIDDIDLSSLENDAQILMSQIKNLIQEMGVPLNQKIIDVLNRAVLESHYTKIRATIAQVFNIKDKRIYETITPRLMELNNLARVLQSLNQLPGTSGKAVNLIKIPLFKL